MSAVLSLSNLVPVIRAGVPALIEVGTARDFGRLRIEAVRAPSAWAIPLAEVAGQNRFAAPGVTDQRVTVRFAVILAVRDIGDRTGAQGLHGLDEVRGDLIDCLSRHRPAGAAETCLHVRGALASGIDDAGMLFWQDEFTTAFDRRITLGG